MNQHTWSNTFRIKGKRLLRRLPRSNRRKGHDRSRTLCFEQLESRVLLSTVSFGVIGDFGDDSTAEADVAALIADLNPDFVVTAGDNRYGSRTYQQTVGDHFGQFLPVSSGGTSATNRFFPSTGNHDYNDGGGINEYLSYFDLPGAGVTSTNTSGTERYYDAVIGDVHLFMIDSSSNTGTNGTQQQWLEATMQASTSAWQVVVTHHAPYSSSSNHGSQGFMQWDYAQWGADAVIAGHDHIYERINRDGIKYFVNGLGGRSFYGIGSAVTGSQFRYNSNYGAMKVVATETEMTFEFFNRNGSLIDSDMISQAPLLPEVSIVATDANAAEPSNNGTFTVSRTGDTTDALTVNYAIAGTAGNGDDYNTLTGSVTIAAGDTSATIVVDPIDDNTVEGDETVELTLTADAAYTLGTADADTVTIADDDAQTVSIAATNADAGEPADTGTFTVTRVGKTTDALTVHYAIAGSAANGTDYDSLSGSVIIAAGETSATIDVIPIDDAEIEDDETVLLSLVEDPAYFIGAASNAVVTIADDDAQTVSIVATDADAGEPSNNGTFTVTRVGKTTDALTVNYSIAGTADNGTDYNTLSGSVIIAVGEASAIITVAPVDDELNEGNETVVLTLVEDPAYFIGAASNAIVTMADDENSSPTVSITSPTSGETFAAGDDITITANAADSDGTITQVTFFQNGVLLGTDTSGSFSFSFNNVVAGNYTLTAVATDNDGATTVSDPVIISVTTPPVVLGVDNVFDNKNDKFYFPNGPDGSAPFDDINSPAEEGDLEVESGNNFYWEFRYDDLASTSEDPAEVIATLQFRAEQNWSGTFTAQYRVNGAVLASTELPATSNGSLHVFEWDLSDVATTVDTVNDGRIRVLNQPGNGKKVFVSHAFMEVAFPVEQTQTVSIVTTDADAGEPSNNGTFTVVRSGDTTDVLAVNYTIAGTATNGTDYNNLSGSVIIGAGETSATINVTPIDDTQIEGDEMVELTLESDPAYVIDASSSAILTITDDDAQAVSIVASDASAMEPSGNGRFTVTRVGSTTNALTVNYAVAGTADNGVDYNNLSGSVTIAAGDTEAIIRVRTIDDVEIEDDETVELTLESDPAYVIGDSSNAVVTIADDDAQTVSIVATDDAGEPSNNGRFTVTRVGSTTNALTVNYAIAGTADNGTDYVTLNGSVTIAAGDSRVFIRVRTIDDAQIEDDETVMLLLVDDPAYTVGASNQAAITITSDDVFASVVDRHLFYNDSAFDGKDALANDQDDNAIATDKEALLPSSTENTATFLNYSSYTKGINGVMIDIENLTENLGSHELVDGDFQFHVGNNNDPGNWTQIMDKATINVRPNAGSEGSDRVTITFPDNLFRNVWLQVTVTTDHTGLASPDVFYFGNAVGETGDHQGVGGDAVVSISDIQAIRNQATRPGELAGILNSYDLNRDTHVNLFDLIAARNSRTDNGSALQLIALPAMSLVGAAPFIDSPAQSSVGTAVLKKPRTDDSLSQTDVARTHHRAMSASGWSLLNSGFGRRENRSQNRQMPYDLDMQRIEVLPSVQIDGAIIN